MKKKLQRELVDNPYDKISEIMYNLPPCYLIDNRWTQASPAVVEQIGRVIEKSVRQNTMFIYRLTYSASVWKKEVNDGNPT